MDLHLRGRIALVSGASRGIGAAVAAALGEEGARVALLARGASGLDEMAGRLRASGVDVTTVIADTADDVAARAAVEQVEATWGGVDILVNAAATPASPGSATALAELRPQDLHAEVETKVLGYLRLAQAVAPHMTARGWGRIVNISGLAARQAGSPFGSIRNVAVAAMTKSLADELGPRGVNVTVVHPGLTVTERTPSLIAGVADRAGVDYEEAERRLSTGISIGRMVTAAEVADVVTFLASPLSVSINGDAIAVGGGALGAIYY